MSAIDAFKRTLIGIATCPSRFELVYQNDTHRDVPLYRLDEDCRGRAPDFDGQLGDVLLGGGGGESAALRVTLPKAVKLFTSAVEDDSFAREPEAYFKAYWTFSDAFIFGDGYQKLGWEPRTDLPNWLAENVVAFLLREYPEVYKQFAGTEALAVQGSFLRKPTPEDLLAWR